MRKPSEPRRDAQRQDATTEDVPAGGALSKAALKTELLAMLDAQLDTATKTHKAAREGATHEQAKPENDKDTRALEQSYLARGQAARIEELQSARAQVQAMVVRAAKPAAPIAPGDLVTLEDDSGASFHVWILGQGGGSRLAGGTVQVVTPRSPLGQALLGRLSGDEVELPRPGGLRTFSVLAVV